MEEVKKYRGCWGWCERMGWGMGGRRMGLGMEGHLRAALAALGHLTNEWM